MMKANCKHRRIGYYEFLYLSKRITFISSVLYLMLASHLVYAETIVTPGIKVGETLVDNEFDSFSETGFVTSIQPGIIISSNGAKSDFSMAYGLEILRSHNLDTNDDREVHNLDLNAEYRHIPNQWISYVRANNRLNNANVDGVQNANPEFLDVNSEQLFTLALGSAYSDRLSRDVQYSAGIDLNYANEEGADSTSGQEYLLAIDNFISGNILTWRGQIKRNEYQGNGNNDNANNVDYINELKAIFDYRFDQTLSYFLELTRTETEDSELDENGAIIGFRWSPTRQSFVSVGIGRLGDNETYDFDARITRARSLFSASYTETITTQRDNLFVQQNDQFGQSTNQSTSTTAILRKRGDIGWTLTGVRSTLGLSIFHEEESNPDITDDQITTGGDIIYNRQLSPLSSLSLSGSYQETEFAEKSTLDEYRVSYARSTSKTTDLDLFISYSRFDSTNDAIDYKQTLAGAAFRVTF